jgi:hypothetical protein
MSRPSPRSETPGVARRYSFYSVQQNLYLILEILGTQPNIGKSSASLEISQSMLCLPRNITACCDSSAIVCLRLEVHQYSSDPKESPAACSVVYNCPIQRFVLNFKTPTSLKADSDRVC